MTQGKKFDPKKRKKLNNPTRLQWIPPQIIAEAVGIQKKRNYLDVGAGTGFLSEKIVEDVPSATVQCLDIEPLMVEEMQNHLDQNRFFPLLIEKDILPLAKNSVDGAWSITVFHELGNPIPLLSELNRVLRPGGRLLIIDWEKREEACEQGPPIEHRVQETEVIHALQQAGFSELSTIAGFTHHYGICGVKQ